MSGEPYCEITCGGCGATFHAGDGDGCCPNCDSSSVSYSVSAIREWSAWRDERELDDLARSLYPTPEARRALNALKRRDAPSDLDSGDGVAPQKKTTP